MGRRHAKFIKMYYFLESMQQKEQTFSMQDLLEETGYKESSLRTYYGKRLKGVILEELAGGRLMVSGMERFDEAGFIDYMTQKSLPVSNFVGSSAADDAPAPSEVTPVDEAESGRGLVELLLEHSRQAYELMTRHTLGGDVGWSVRLMLMIEAWEGLLQAELSRIDLARRKRAGTRQVWQGMNRLSYERGEGLLRRFFPNEADPVRCNITWLYRLHERGGQWLVPQTWPLFAGVLSAAATNWLSRWEVVASRSCVLTHRVATCLLQADAPAGEALDLSEVERHHGEVVLMHVVELVREIREAASGFAQRELFCDTPDALWAYGEGWAVSPEVVQRTHPHTRAQIIEGVNQRLPEQLSVSWRDVELLDQSYGVRTSGYSMYYGRALGQEHGSYSQRYMDWIIQGVATDPGWFEALATRNKE